MTGIFTSLAAGSHTVQLWGSCTNFSPMPYMLPNSGGYEEFATVLEF